VIQDLQTIKILIQHNIELCRLHDYLLQNSSASQSVITNSRFNAIRPTWHTFVSSLYTSVVLVVEYSKKQSVDLNSLDSNFQPSSWGIEDVFQADSQGNKNPVQPNLKIVLTRLRNSISHGMYEVISSSPYGMHFYDENTRSKNTDQSKFFTLKIVGTNLDSFLATLDRSFRSKFP
jgi:hypothetical protein